MNWQDWIRHHRRESAALTAGVVIVLLLLIGWLGHRRPAAPFPPGQFQVEGFYENPSPGDPGSRLSFDQHWRHLTMVSPLWFSVNPDGSVTDTGYDNSLVSQAHAHHIGVIPLFVNANGSSDVLWTRATRLKAAAAIRQVVVQDHLDGINLDFELLNPSSRSDLSKFVGDIANQLHPLHKKVLVSVFPLLGVPTSINGAYDYRALGRAADALIIMAYDHHYSGGPPGPVAPYDWVASNVRQALQLVPANRIILAIGMYGYDWLNTGGPGPASTVSDVEAKALAQSHHVPITYLPSESQNRFVYQSSTGSSHVVWFMGDRSAHVRIRLAQTDHLAGIALWRLGMEDHAFWKNVPVSR